MNDALDKSSEQFRYAGFISYSQKDKAWAKRIHRALETYRLPTGIAAAGNKKKGLGRFFRDDDELAGAPSLGEALESSLNASAALVVICSPNSARSKWVDAEIRKFKSRGPSAKVLAIIIDGQPDSDDPEVMCFAPSMLRKVNQEGELTDEPDEPLAPDANKEPFNRLIVRLVAGLLGLEFDTLWQREQRRLRKKRIQIGVAAALGIIGISVGSMMYFEAERQRVLAEQEQFRTDSVNLAISAQTAMDENKVDDALVYALDALPTELENPDRPITPEAIAALKRVMADNRALAIIKRYEQSINEIKILPDGRLALWFDDFSMRVVNAETGAVEWESPEGERLQWLELKSLAASVDAVESLDTQGKLQVQHKVIIRDLATGGIIRQLSSKELKWWMSPTTPTMSPSGKNIVLTRSVSVTKEEENDLGIWQVPAADEDSNPKLIAQIEGPILKDGERLKKRFIDETTVLLSWGGKRQSMALWKIQENKLNTFSTPNSPLACDAKLVLADDERRDKFSLSKNKQIITRARPIKEAGWCVELWDAKTAEKLSAQLIDENKIGSVDALTKEVIVTGRHGRSFSSRAAAWQENKRLTGFPQCQQQRTDTLDALRVEEVDWLIDSKATLSACVNDNHILVYRGKNYAIHETLYGHESRVRAVAYDNEKSRLYSAGEDGQLRAWDFANVIDSNIEETNIISMVSDKGVIAALYQETDKKTKLRIYDVNGIAITAPISYEIKTAKEDKYGIELAMLLLDEGKTIAIIEKSECQYNCPPGLVRQIALYKVETGKKLVEVDNLNGGHFLADIPISHTISKQGKRIALARLDGSVVEIDTATGKSIKTHHFNKGFINDVVYNADVLWVLASDGEDDPYERHMRLIMVNDKGQQKEVWHQRAQAGNLYGSPMKNYILLELNLTHSPKQAVRYAVINSENKLNEISLPKTHMRSNPILRSVYYYANESHAALLFSDNGVAPLDINLATGENKVIGASLPVSMLDTWRVDDPLRRVVASVDNSQLFIQTLPKQPALCAELANHPADAAAFSTDGKLLAISESYDEKLTVYDLESCSAVYKINMGIGYNGELTFIDSNTLWAITKKNDIRVMNINVDLESIHERAKTLRQSLGLVSAVKPSVSEN